MRIAILGFALPFDRFTEFLLSETGMPIQTQRFGTSLIAAIRAAGGAVEVLSTAPATDFPHNRTIMFRSQHLKTDSWRVQELGFVNITGIKHLTRYMTARPAVKRVPTNLDAILVHGLNSALLWAAIAAGRRRRVPVLVVMTDPPSRATRYDNRLTAFMKVLDKRIISRALSKVDGVITVTGSLAAHFAPRAPALTMEGIASRLPSLGVVPRSARPRVIYAGGLREEYGVRALIQSLDLSASDWELHLYGRGPLESDLHGDRWQSERLFLHGMADTNELARAYAGADVLVNPRDPDSDFVSYSFPSKLLEYLSSGRPVITTRLPTIPSDYNEHLTYCRPDASGIAAAIDSVLAVPCSEREAASARAAEFISATRGPEAQGRRILSFVAHLASTKR